MLLEGICAWAHVQKSCGERTVEIKEGPRKGKTFTSKDEYRLDLFIEPKIAKQLKEKGYRVKVAKKEVSGIPDSAGKPFIKINKPPKDKNGNPLPKPQVFDIHGDELTCLIGNGSKVEVQYQEYEYVGFTGEVAISCRLEKIMVIDLVSFGGLSDNPQTEFSFEKKENPTDFTFDDGSSEEVPW